MAHGTPCSALVQKVGYRQEVTEVYREGGRQESGEAALKGKQPG
jgi:hypothetical protein